MEEIISLSNVTVHTATVDRPILEAFNLRVEKGTLTVLFGAGGTGKTTLFKLLTGELKPDEGSVHVGNWDVAGLPNSHVAEYRRSIGVIFQDVPLLAHLMAEGEIVLPLELAGMNRARRRERMESIIERFQLQDVRETYPTLLSMGMR